MTQCVTELDQVNERSTSYVTIEFYDKNDQLEQPISGTYQINDYYSGVEMKALTAFQAPSGTYEVTVAPDENAILDTNLPGEIRVLTAIGYYGSDDAVKAEFKWEVVNLRYEPV